MCWWALEATNCRFVSRLCGCASLAGQAAFLFVFFAAFFFAARALVFAAGFFGVVGEVVVALAFLAVAAVRSCDTAGRASSSAAAAVVTP